MLGSGVLTVRQLVARPRICGVRYLPLGSPTSTPKRSYVHVPSGPRPVACSSVGQHAWCPACGQGGYREGAIPGSTHPPTRYSLFGIARAQPMPLQALSASAKALQALGGPSAHLGSSHSAWPSQHQIGRDSIIYILKLVIIRSVTIIR